MFAPRSRILVVAGLVLMAGAAPARAQDRALSDEELAALAARLDDDADPLHADYTPVVFPLCDAGPRGALAVVDRLDAPDPMTRLHAQRVVECVGMRWEGWTQGRGFPDGQPGETRVRALLHDNGDYAANGPADARRASMARWRRWLEARRDRPYPPPMRPWPEQITGGLRAAFDRANQCLPQAVPTARVQITLARDGSVARVVVWPELTNRSARGCVQRALRAGRVPPFRGPPITFLTRLRH